MISTERLEELKSEVGEDDFDEIVALFIAESDTIVDRLKHASDPGEAGDLLHALKGSALNLGFDALARLCREAEASGNGGLCPQLKELFDVYERSKTHLGAIV
ncbi:MAG: Hpt domain-containing protein [Rhodobacteraceae bacterium]|nr:Hpt domain-containing protein [Paracoccaceae bacterium]